MKSWAPWFSRMVAARRWQAGLLARRARWNAYAARANNATRWSMIADQIETLLPSLDPVDRHAPAIVVEAYRAKAKRMRTTHLDHHRGEDMKIDKAVHEMAAEMRRKRAESVAEREKRRSARPEPAGPVAASGEPTAERLAHAANDVETTDGIIDRAGERKPTTRRFRDAPIDRLHRQGWVGEREHRAAEWYLNAYERAGIEQRVVARYDDSSGGGSDAADTRRHAARLAWRQARAVIPANLADIADNCILHRMAPPLANGRQRERYAATINRALAPLAAHLGL